MAKPWFRIADAGSRKPFFNVAPASVSGELATYEQLGLGYSPGAGQFVSNNISADALKIVTATPDEFQLYPWVVPAKFTVVSMGVLVTTAKASSSIKLGMYHADDLGRPSSLYIEIPPIATTSTGFKFGGPPGVYPLNRGELMYLFIRYSHNVKVNGHQNWTLPSLGGWFGTPTNVSPPTCFSRITNYLLPAPANWGWVASESLADSVAIFVGT